MCYRPACRPCCWACGPCPCFTFPCAPWADLLFANRSFALAGFDDHTSYNLMPGFNLLPAITLPLTVLGFLAGAVLLARNRARLAGSPEKTVGAVFLCWASASLLLLLVLELNVNRFNHFFLPAMALGTWAAARGGRRLPTAWFRRGVQVLLAAFLLLEGSLAARHYFTQYPRSEILLGFNAGLGEAYGAVARLPVNQVRLPANILFLPLHYNYALFYLAYPPAAFQQSGDFAIQGGRYQVKRFGRYLFHDSFLDRSKPFGYLRRKSEPMTFPEGVKQIVYENQAWEVGLVVPPSR